MSLPFSDSTISTSPINTPSHSSASSRRPKRTPSLFMTSPPGVESVSPTQSIRALQRAIPKIDSNPGGEHGPWALPRQTDETTPQVTANSTTTSASASSSNMLSQGAHVFSHQNFSHGEPAWLNQHSHQQQTTHQQAQAQAAAAHASAAHYRNLQATHNGAQVPNLLPGQAHDSGMMDNVTEENRRVLIWIAELLNEDTRESALLELSKKREQVPELALILWHSFGVMTSLLQEIISVYTLLNPSQLTAAASNRVCNALALLQCVASHNETRALFLNAHIPLFLYPFLNTTSKSRPFEYLRLTSLGVIGALVKNDSSDVINFLLTTEIIPLCLRIMETGSELSKTVAIFIVQKILLDDHGLNYICATYERFYAVGTVLSNMVNQLVEQQTARLLKHVVRCFLRLSDNARAREALRQCLPEPLRDATFSSVLRDDAATKRCLAQLLINLSDSVVDNNQHGL